MVGACFQKATFVLTFHRSIILTTHIYLMLSVVINSAINSWDAVCRMPTFMIIYMFLSSKRVIKLP